MPELYPYLTPYLNLIAFLPVQEGNFEAALASCDAENFPIEEFKKLNEAHHKNYDILMQYLNDYQPQAFGKNWSHDPDYKALKKEFFDVDKTHGSGARMSAARPIETLKTKKKTKKIR